ncbi:MAG: hypothetical protein CMJ45_14570 [Planctomyces sp.]|nr:hypothetical protein [Planctomyces sp.]
MSFHFYPFQVALAVFSEFIRGEQEQAIEYLQLENQVLREKLGGNRVLLSDDQRRLSLETETSGQLAESAETPAGTGQTRKRPAAEESAPGVDWCVGQVRRKRTSSPSHPLSERGLVELGAFRINNLRRSPKVEFYPWNPISTMPKPKCEQKKPRPSLFERS